MNENSIRTLAEAIDDFKGLLGDGDRAYVILYTPKDCHLLLLDKDGKFFNEDGEFTPQSVFEARIFNDKAELRWLNESNGKGKVAIISDTSFADAVDSIPQTYLVWGQSTGKFSDDGNWTQFATARIGSFYVPLPKVPERHYARFMALEYLKTYEEGNVAVVDERLRGIEGYKGD